MFTMILLFREPNPMLRAVNNFLADESGPTAVEYAILLALMVGMMIASLTYVGDEAQAMSDICVTGIDQALNK
jgi:Flp pilus assembly pilin Flp